MEERHQPPVQQQNGEQEMSRWSPPLGVEQAPMSLPPPFRDNADDADDASDDNSEVFYDAFFDEPSGSSFQEMATATQPQHIMANSFTRNPRKAAARLCQGINRLRPDDREADYVEEEEENYERGDFVDKDEHDISTAEPEIHQSLSEQNQNQTVPIGNKQRPSRVLDISQKNGPKIIQEDMDGSVSSRDEKPKFRAAQNMNISSRNSNSGTAILNDESRKSTISMASSLSLGASSQHSLNGSKDSRVSFGQEQHRVRRIKNRWEDSGSRVSASGRKNSQQDSSLESDNESSSSGSSSSSSSSSSSESSRGAALRQRPGRPGMDRATALGDTGKPPSGRRLKALMAFKEATKSVRHDMTGKENFNFKTMVRQSRQIDMETGVKSTREFTAQRVTDQEYLQPMDPRQRRKQMFIRKQKEKLSTELDKSRHKFNLSVQRQKSLGLGVSLNPDLDEEPVVQYRLSSMIAKDDNSFFKDSFHLLREYLYWCLRKSFLAVLATESVIFLAWCWMFAILYYLLGTFNPQCIVGSNGLDFEEGNMGFVDAFTLSWTTFSTVGYGHIHPQIHGEGTNTRCAFVTMLASWQSFVGVQAASFCSAIIFAKIAKTQSIAHVAFSENVVIRFGQELVQGAARKSTKSNPAPERFMDSFRFGLGDVKNMDRFPCPILEFRIVNLLHSEKGGEIMNCKLNVVASSLEEVTNVDHKESQARSGSGFMEAVLPSKQVVRGMKKLQKIKDAASKKVHTSGQILKKGTIIQKVNRTITEFTATRHAAASGDDSESGEAEAEPYKEDDGADNEFPDFGFSGLGDEYEVEEVEIPSDDDEKPPAPTSTRRRKGRKLTEPKKRTTKSKRNSFDDENDPMNRSNRSAAVFIDEEAFGGNGCPRRVFSKIELETDSHPFFKRVWNIRHILSEDSPLLNNDARKLIQENGGFWPASMCNADVIKSCLEMSQLIVTLSGTAVVSGSSVYKLNVYDLEHAEIGRTFIDALALGHDGKLTVDLSLLSATTPQHEEKVEDGMSDGSINLDSGDRGQSRFGGRRLSMGVSGLTGF